jgi:type II secretory pathway predicted ATPase ExeA
MPRGLVQLSRNVRTALVLNPSLTESQLLRAILHDFGLKPKGAGPAQLHRAAQRVPLGQITEGYNVAVIIDEARICRRMSWSKSGCFPTGDGPA